MGRDASNSQSQRGQTSSPTLTLTLTLPQPCPKPYPEIKLVYTVGHPIVCLTSHGIGHDVAHGIIYGVSCVPRYGPWDNPLYDVPPVDHPMG